ncbi:hypothetical protein PanWU01x14_087300 [Parasponia andersonii]|uniref:Uncharacterized protein n=1 Tax=Parasponia andersonii TaxID=3476 RepID=A0A2P5D8H3_PARAD|nr:hypothetical protein PanWU01x14_087300 [Parasponia andersonii]
MEFHRISNLRLKKNEGSGVEERCIGHRKKTHVITDLDDRLLNSSQQYGLMYRTELWLQNREEILCWYSFSSG